MRDDLDIPSQYGCVVIGASAGGIRAVGEILAALPDDFPLPILLVQHLSPTQKSRLVEVLGYRTGLRVKWAQWGEKASGGTVYVAPPDRHLLLQRNGRVALCASDPVDWWRPAIDRLFESAAAAIGPRAVGIVLSGTMWDGVAGLTAIRRAGGLTFAQDEASCDHFDMPAAAIDLAGADIILPPRKIAHALVIASEIAPEAA